MLNKLRIPVKASQKFTEAQASIYVLSSGFASAFDARTQVQFNVHKMKIVLFKNWTTGPMRMIRLYL